MKNGLEDFIPKPIFTSQHTKHYSSILNENAISSSALI